MNISRREFTTLLGLGLVITTVNEATALATEHQTGNTDIDLPEKVPVTDEVSLMHSDVRYLPLIFDY